MLKSHLSLMAFALSLLSSTSAWASNSTAVEWLKEAYFMVGGYPDDFYSSHYPNPDDAPAQEGMAGILDNIGVGVKTAVTATGITKCADLPSAEVQTVTITLKKHEFSGKITFVKPTFTIPTGLTGAGASFDAAANIIVTIQTGFEFKGHVEWSCSNPVAAAVLENPGSTLKGTTQKFNIFVDHTDTKAEVVEFSQLLTDTATGTKTWDAQIEHLVKNSETGAFNIYVAYIYHRGGDDTNNVYTGENGSYTTQTIQIAGNPSSSKFSAWSKSGKVSGNDLTAVSGSVAAPTAVGVATSDFSIADTGGTTYDIRGCIDGAASNASVAGDCSGYSLNATPPDMIVGSGLKFTLDDAKKLRANMLTLP